tara:strand:- start:17196 stop:17828 length:633 start_codon:yes stop_codon:yes gene_type:complete
MTVSKVVVFDLDETLGDFGDLSLRWPSEVVEKKRFAQFCSFMNDNIEVYSDLVNVLPKIVESRRAGRIEQIVIYTNNCAHASWACAIAGHIGWVHGTRVFDAVVAGYKPELGPTQCRLGPAKTYQELCNCLGLEENTRMCFIDDQEHKGMRHANVSYVKTSPYKLLGNSQMNNGQIAEVLRFCSTPREHGTRRIKVRKTGASRTKRVERT